MKLTGTSSSQVTLPGEGETSKGLLMSSVSSLVWIVRKKIDVIAFSRTAGGRMVGVLTVRIIFNVEKRHLILE